MSPKHLRSPKDVENDERKSSSHLVTKQDLVNMERRIMAELTALEAQVKANTDVEASAVVLIQGIAAKLEAAKTDPVKLGALVNELKTSGDALAAAIVANTPAE